MSLTISLIREMEFISTYLKTPVHFTFYLKYPLDIKIDNKIMQLKYNDFPIWKENVSLDGMCNVESMDAISRIIYGIDNNGDWKHLLYFES